MLRTRILGIFFLLIASMSLSIPHAFGDNKETTTWVAGTYDNAIAMIQKGNFKAAQAQAQKLVNSTRWKSGDVVTAACIRGIANELVAAKQDAMAKQLLADAEKAHSAKGVVALAFKGLTMPRMAGKEIAGPPVIAATHPFNPARDLRRIRNGNQASILKVMDESNTRPAYVKYMFNGAALDGVTWAPIYPEHREGMFKALGINPNGLDALANQMIGKYSRGISVQGLALLGVIGSTPGGALTPATRAALQKYLLTAMWKSKAAVNKRQALLALALLDTVDEATVNDIVRYYGQSYNPYAVFPVSQFFQYHAGYIKSLPGLAGIKERISHVDSFYTPQILSFL